MEKRGEILTARLAVILVALIVFAVLAWFIYSVFIDTQGLNNRKICELSVSKRGLLEKVGAGGLSPLQCTTEKICITTKRSGECEQFAGEENIRNVVVDISKPNEAKKIIEMESANAMWDCWAMMNQGRVDIFGPKIVDDLGDVIWNNFQDFMGFDANLLMSTTTYEVTKPKCVVCSRVAIAKDVFEKDNGVKIVEGVNVNRYLAEENIPGSGLTYLQAFTDSQIVGYQGVDQRNYVPEDIEEDERESLSEFKKEFKRGDVYESNQLAFVFSQVKFKDKNALTAGKNVAITGGIIIGTALFLTPVGAVVIAATSFGTATIISLGAIGATAGYAAGSTAINKKRNQIVTAGYCGDLQSKSNDKTGCSLIKAVNWDVKTLNEFCLGGIEGNP